jgi:molybdopterin-binding protein
VGTRGEAEHGPNRGRSASGPSRGGGSGGGGGGGGSRRRTNNPPERAPASSSRRNAFPGVVTKVTRDTVSALVEIQAGPHRVVSLITREAADELDLEPGVKAVATVKATSVMIEVEK